MAKRYDICAPRKGRDDKTFWHRIGTAWEGDKGIQLVFDSLPIPDADGRCAANLFEPREKTGGTDAPTGGQRSSRQAPVDDLDDAIPFLTNRGVW